MVSSMDGIENRLQCKLSEIPFSRWILWFGIGFD